MNLPTAGQLTDAELGRLVQRRRWLVLSTVSRVKAGHIGGDRFTLSKGYNMIAVYSVMALRRALRVTQRGRDRRTDRHGVSPRRVAERLEEVVVTATGSAA